ncbi:hypothetical protein GCM10009113_07940 [Marinobacter szutsaonensis]
MNFEVRRGCVEDAQGIVDLFSEGGNPHSWSYEKWQHYYQLYPEGDTVTFVAESQDGIIGHYGLFPVTIGDYSVYLGAHAYISESVRGLAVISQLMKALDEFCTAEGVPFIVGFANPRFTTVKTKLFKWRTPFYASFVKCSSFNPEHYQSRPFMFSYSDKWINWRFGPKAGNPVISRYQKSDSEPPVFQVLHTTKPVEASSMGLPELECWSPDGYIKMPANDHFSQPFSIKIYDRNWEGPDLCNPDNWFIQMGDSDTFLFRAI